MSAAKTSGSDAERRKSSQHKHITDEQKSLLVQFIAEHPKMVAKKFDNHFTNVHQQQLWEELKSMLHGCVGPKKDTTQWKTSWRDLKSAAKKKGEELKKLRGKTGNDGLEKPEELSPLHKQILEILSRAVVSGEPQMDIPVAGDEDRSRDEESAESSSEEVVVEPNKRKSCADALGDTAPNKRKKSEFTTIASAAELIAVTQHRQMEQAEETLVLQRRIAAAQERSAAALEGLLKAYLERLALVNELSVQGSNEIQRDREPLINSNTTVSNVQSVHTTTDIPPSVSQPTVAKISATRKPTVRKTTQRQRSKAVKTDPDCTGSDLVQQASSSIILEQMVGGDFYTDSQEPSSVGSESGDDWLDELMDT